MTIKTLIKYLQFFEDNDEVKAKVCKRTRTTLPMLNPWNETKELDIEIPLLCAPTFEIELVVKDRLTPNAPVLIVI